MSGFHLGFSRWYISLAASVWSDDPHSFGYLLPIWWRRSLRLHANSCAYHLCSFSRSNSCRDFRVWSDGSRSLSCAPCAYKNAIPPELILLESLDCDLFSFVIRRLSVSFLSGRLPFITLLEHCSASSAMDDCHQWQPWHSASLLFPYFQQSPPLALMAILSFISPPLTSRAKG